MYKAAVRALIRRNLRQLNEGDYEPMLKMVSPDAEFAFPGDNSWSTQHRPHESGREQHTTHRGLEEITTFADRFVAEGLRLEIEDILVNGPPWDTRICVRAHDYITGDDGADRYNNRVALLIEARWGKIRRWEDYEDTERVAAWDQRTATSDT